MQTPLLNTLGVAAVLVLAIPALKAQGTPPPAKPAAVEARPLANPQANQSAYDRFEERVRNPTDWLSWGADLRVRDEFLENTFMSAPIPGGPPPAPGTRYPDYNQIRIRARMWGTVKPVSNLDLNLRFAWESRVFTKPDEPVPAYAGGASMVDAFELDEFLIDNLNFRFTNILNQPASLTVGRQDLFLGNGWFTGDGTPRDGSRTYFLDAARMVWNFPEAKTLANLIYIEQRARSDAWLPPINEQAYRRYLTEQDERGVILYVSNKSISKTTLDGYFIYKHDEKALGSGAEGDIFGFGARASVDLSDHWNLRAEFMPQFGEKQIGAGPEQDLEAFGANTLLTYSFKDSLKNQAHVGYEYLSGDDAGSTGQNERFDPLWGRWPQWSELLVYNLSTGPRPVDWGNLHRLNAGWGFSPTKKSKVTADYHALFAPTDDIRPIGTGGNFRGHLATANFEYVHSIHLRGHLRAECFWPGDYYDGTGLNTDMETFLRAEILLTF